MQQPTVFATIRALAPEATTDAPAPVAPVATTEAAKPAKPRKPAAAKPAKPPVNAAAAKPEPAKPAASQPDDTGDRAAERAAAAKIVRDYYAGRSLPFKAASDVFAPFRTDKQPKAPTERQAALLASMLLSGDNIKRNGTFTRGGFTFDGRNVQPETGCLSDMHGRVVSHVSGPLLGKQAREATFRLDLKRARAEIQQFLGDKLGKAAIARIDQLLAKPVKPEAGDKQAA